jgi:hypothetical protein
MNKLCKLIMSLAGVLGLAFSLFFFFESRYALSDMVAQIEQRLDYKIVSDQYMDMQKRIWTIEERYPAISRAPATVQEELRELKIQRELLKEQLEKFKGKK